MKKPECLRLFLLMLAGMLVLALLAVGAVYWLFHSEDYSMAEVNDILGAAIPSDASNIVIAGQKGLSDGLPVYFDAPPVSAKQFAEQFCDGVLYQGYDPFNAVDTGDPFTYAHAINLGIFRYFSYSLQTPKTLSGNRCLPLSKYGAYLQIVLDASHSDLEHVKIELFSSCDACQAYSSSSLPLMSTPSLWLIGAVKDGTSYRMVGQEICIGTMPDATDTFAVWGDMVIAKTEYAPPVDYEATQAYTTWRPLTPATIEIDLYNRMVASAEVDTEDQLVDRRDRAGNSVAANASGNDRFYCFDPQVSSGSHQMQIRLTAADGTTKTYQWTLIVLSSGSTFPQ